jgi:hypothetical protein
LHATIHLYIHPKWSEILLTVLRSEGIGRVHREGVRQPRWSATSRKRGLLVFERLCTHKCIAF